ncbi:RHS repeat-associated core domain-containing protein [Pseudomonas entomophila]|uniref:RHS repeat-associated core domain-containing protein n=1 Tax=Pseudomonas entomophila TaxID=312306 RepID=UPI003EBA1238
MKMRDCTWSNRFYLHDRFVAEVGTRNRRLMWASDSPLVACDHQVRLLETNREGSLLRLSATGAGLAYTPYGQASGLPQDIPCGFNGQQWEHAIRGYALGNGKRFYSPGLARFVQPDRLSPFLEGGLNAYGYCQGDPVNRVDPSGQFPSFHHKSYKPPQPISPNVAHSSLSGLFMRKPAAPPGKIRIVPWKLQVDISPSDVKQAFRSIRWNFSRKGMNLQLPLGTLFDELPGSTLTVSAKGVEVTVPTLKAAQAVIGNVAKAPAPGTATLSMPLKTLWQAQKQVLSTSTTIVLDWKTVSDMAYDTLAEQFKSIRSS